MESFKIKKMFHKIKTFFRKSINTKKISKRDSNIDSGIDPNFLSNVSPKSSEDDFMEAMSKCSVKENSFKPIENQKVLQNTTSNSLDFRNSNILKNNVDKDENQQTSNSYETSKINDGFITVQIKIKKSKSSKHKDDKKNEKEKENINTVTDVDKLNENLMQLNLSNKTVDQPKRNNKDKIGAILENIHNKTECDEDLSKKSVKNKISKDGEKKEKKKIVYCARGPQDNLILTIDGTSGGRVIHNTQTEDKIKGVEEIEKMLIRESELFMQRNLPPKAIFETNQQVNHTHHFEPSPPHIYEEYRMNLYESSPTHIYDGNNIDIYESSPEHYNEWNNINHYNSSPGDFSEGYYSEMSNNSSSESPTYTSTPTTTWLPDISSPDSVLSETNPYLTNSYPTTNNSLQFPIKDNFKSSFDNLDKNVGDNIVSYFHNISENRLIDQFNGLLSKCNEPQNELFLPQLFVICERLLQRPQTTEKFFVVYSNGHTILDRAVRQCSRYTIVGNYLAECMLRALTTLQFKDVSSRFFAVLFTRRNSNANTILHRVAKDGDKYSSLLKDIFLLNSFSDSPVENMNELDSDGYAPLHIACMTPSRHTMQTHHEEQICTCLQTTLKFLENNADPNIMSSKGDTPLHRAIDWSDCAVNLVELLLQYGADPSIENHSGETPLSKATENFKKTPTENSRKILQLMTINK